MSSQCVKFPAAVLGKNQLYLATMGSLPVCNILLYLAGYNFRYVLLVLLCAAEPTWVIPVVMQKIKML